jgi:hypothetical protein
MNIFKSLPKLVKMTGIVISFSGGVSGRSVFIKCWELTTPQRNDRIYLPASIHDPEFPVAIAKLENMATLYRRHVCGHKLFALLLNYLAVGIALSGCPVTALELTAAAVLMNLFRLTCDQDVARLEVARFIGEETYRESIRNIGEWLFYLAALPSDERQWSTLGPLLVHEIDIRNHKWLTFGTEFWYQLTGQYPELNQRTLSASKRYTLSFEGTAISRQIITLSYQWLSSNTKFKSQSDWSDYFKALDLSPPTMTQRVAQLTDAMIKSTERYLAA